MRRYIIREVRHVVDVSSLEGIWPVMPTPYTESDEIDLDCVKALVHWYVESGCNGVLVSGSGGEFPYLTIEERIALTRAAVEASEGRIPIMCGLGPMGTKEATNQARDAVRRGASFVLAAMPTYYPISFLDALDHYRAIADAAFGRALYYHFPQTTRFDPGPEGAARISSLDGLLGIKMSRPNLREMRIVLKLTDQRPFALFSGTVLLLEEVMSMGGAGSIGIIPAVFPKESAEWFAALKRGDKSGANRASRTIKKAIGLLAGFGAPAIVQYWGLKVVSKLPFPVSLGSSSNHAAVKEALRLRGFPIRTDVRGPLPKLTMKTADEVATLLRRLKILDYT